MILRVILRVKQFLGFVMLASVLSICIFPPQPSIAAPKRALLQEDVSYVNANVYGAGLNATTLNAALSALGTTNKRTLFLATGVWNLAVNVTVPLNITLWIPSGTTVTINGGVTFTVHGPLIVDADNTTWHSGAGTFVWDFVSAADVGSGLRSIRQDGAVCDGTTNDGVAIQATITYCLANNCGVFIPESVNGCLVNTDTNPLVINGTGLQVSGASSYWSRIEGTGAGTIFAVTGDNHVFRNFRLRTTSTTAKWLIKLDLARNTRIEGMFLANSSTFPKSLNTADSGGIFATNDSFATRIIGNVFSGTQADSAAISMKSNAGSGATILGNRFDGVSIAAGGTAIQYLGRGAVITGNVMESFGRCMDIVFAGGLTITGNYFEACGTSIINSGLAFSYGVEITGNSFSVSTLSNYVIDIQIGLGYTIKGNNFVGATAEIGGYRTAINANYLSNRGWVVGPNNFNESDEVGFTFTREIVLHTSFAEKNIDVQSEHQYFNPKNLLQGTFESWPSTNRAPGSWAYSSVVPTRVNDSHFGRFGADLSYTAALVNFIYPVISSTQYVGLRGRFAVFCLWMKPSVGTGTLQTQVLDGVQSIASSVATVAGGWARNCTGIRIDPAATKLEVIIDNITVGTTIRVSSPGMWIGTTLPKSPMADPIWGSFTSGPLAVDATTHISSGAGDQQLVAATVPARTLGDNATMHVRAFGTVAGTTDAKTITLRYGGVTLGTISELAADTADWSIEAEIFTTAAGVSQRIIVTTKAGTAFKQFDYLTATVNNGTSDQDIEIRANPVNAGDTVSVTYFRVDVTL